MDDTIEPYECDTDEFDGYSPPLLSPQQEAVRPRGAGNGRDTRPDPWGTPVYVWDTNSPHIDVYSYLQKLMHERITIAMAFEDHEMLYGVPCGPTLGMLPKDPYCPLHTGWGRTCTCSYEGQATLPVPRMAWSLPRQGGKNSGTPDNLGPGSLLWAILNTPPPPGPPYTHTITNREETDMRGTRVKRLRRQTGLPHPGRLHGGVNGRRPQTSRRQGIPRWLVRSRIDRPGGLQKLKQWIAGHR